MTVFQRLVVRESFHIAYFYLFNLAVILWLHRHISEDITVVFVNTTSIEVKISFY